MKKRNRNIKPNFVYPEIKQTDYVFGSGQIQGQVLNLDRDWRPFIPPFEEQRRNGVESSTCFIQALQHTIASLLEKSHGVKDQNFSERFNLIFTDASPSGGDPLKAAQSFRDKGLIPDEMLPFSSDIKSWQEFRSFKGGDQTKCEAEGKRWRKEWSPRYDIVVTREMDVKTKYARLKDALLYSPCPVSVAQNYDNGLPKPKGVSDIHLVELLHIDEVGRPTILDTYYPFIKTLGPYYNFDFGMRMSIEKTAIEEAQIGIIKKLINALLELVGLLNKEQATSSPNVRPEAPQPQPEAVKYLWDTPKNARHSVRVICDEEGLSLADKNLITAVIQCESGFNPKAENKNKDGTTDWGICQYNDYWYIKRMKLITKDQALNDPEYCVRLMIKRFKEGALKDWVCYKSGAFSKLL